MNKKVSIGKVKRIQMNQLSQWVGRTSSLGLSRQAIRWPFSQEISSLCQRNESRLYVCRPTDLIPILKCSCNALCRVFGVHLRPWRSFITRVLLFFLLSFCGPWGVSWALLFFSFCEERLLITWTTSQSPFGSLVRGHRVADVRLSWAPIPGRWNDGGISILGVRFFFFCRLGCLHSGLVWIVVDKPYHIYKWIWCVVLFW